MAKASAHITLTYVIDIVATYRYYLLQSSTMAKPSVPTTNPPSSSWTDAEPTYTSGSTNSLYYVDLTVFSDDSFSYSPVSLSTAYEAAKEAYNKADNAQTRISEAETKIEKTDEAITLCALKTETVPVPTITDNGSQAVKITNALRDSISGITLYGKTTQDGTPTPDAPIDLVSVGEATGDTLTWDGNTDGLFIALDEEEAFTGTGGYCKVSDVVFTEDDLSSGIIVRCSNGEIYADVYFSELDAGILMSDYGFIISVSEEGAGTDFGGLIFSEVGTYLELPYDGNYISSITIPGYTGFGGGSGGINITITDGTENNVQTLTISTPNGLPGIPVSSGGNYTDSTGQQWICDEIDLVRGVHVQRIGKLIATAVYGVGTHTNGTAYGLIAVSGLKANVSIRSTRYAGSSWTNVNNRIYTTNGAIVITDNRFTSKAEANAILSAENPEIIYKLTEPVETPISDEEIAEFIGLSNASGYVVIASEAEMVIELAELTTGKSIAELTNTMSTQLEVLSDRIEMNFDTASKQYNDVNGKLEVEIVSRKKHITYAGDTAITIGGNSGIMMSLDNDNGIIFSKIVSVTGSNPDDLDSTISTTYQLHNSNVTAPTGTWNVDLPDMSSDDAAEKFLWIRRTATYTDGTTSTMDSVAFGTWDGDNFHTGSIFIKLNERAQFGNFAYIPRSDGSLSFLKVGG